MAKLQDKEESVNININIVGRKIARAQFHGGYGDTARTGCHAEKDKCFMTPTPAGIYIKSATGKEVVVTYANTLWFELMPETV